MFGWIFGTKKESEKELTHEIPGPQDKVGVQRIAIIVGHTKKSKGAVNYKGESEYDFNKRIAKEIKDYLDNFSKKTTGIFLRDGIGRSGVAQAVAAWNADLSIELHFNSFETMAYGCEILVWNRSRNFTDTVIMADEMTDDLARAFNLRERNSFKTEDGIIRDGVLILTDKDRGSYNLRAMEDAGVKYSMLIEPCFANYKNTESEAIFENEKKYAETIAEYLTGL